VWGIGSKAIYAAEQGCLKVIDIDTIGSVAMDDLDIVLTSKSDQSSIRLECPVSDTYSQSKILSDIQARVS
jgi:hypothetical protein